ncbi:restless-like transposase [Purpureocillium lavendulum]|uniref:Restless-like transposase n=1 Tax=Purpureocillium lavendulum TaxID=1247861 RepID=A0AB34FDC0_9HYPO|nr:restless-like transposase [Purpureocillium lavendulum]
MCRDKEQVSGESDLRSLFRRANGTLTEENLRLKQILRRNSISWSPVAQAHFKHPEQPCIGFDRARHIASAAYIFQQREAVARRLLRTDPDEDISGGLPHVHGPKPNRYFAELSPNFRRRITSIRLRIVAR